MKKIKTRKSTRDIKVIDKAGNLTAKIKNNLIRTKDKVQNFKEIFADDGQITPDEYAQDEVKNIADNAVQFAKNTAKKTYDGGKTLVREVKQKRQTGDTTKQTAKSATKTIKRDIKTQQYVKNAYQTKENAVKATKTIKTAKQATNIAKLAGQTINASNRAAKASAKASKKSAEAARATAKIAKDGVKSTVKATIAAVKAIKMSVKGLISVIVSGGSVAVIVTIMICVIALVAGSCFGIFYSGDDTGSGMSMRTAITEINTEYQEKIEQIKSENTHDVIKISGSKAVWKDVLAVYAVKTTNDRNNPIEVATMDNTKLKILKDVFWEMNSISYKTDTKKETVIKEKDDGKGNIIEIKVTEMRTYLYITVTHKTVNEMSVKYDFNAEQKGQLTELLSEDNAKLWSGILHGYTVGNEDIVAVALSQIGNIGGEPYWRWYGFNSRVEWCACFVSWCANECGYIESGIIPKFAGCGNGVKWFKERGQWQDNTYNPKAGDIIFFDWASDGLSGTADHVGIVEKVENDTVYTIEGNLGDACTERSYPVGYYEVLGFGLLNP